MPKRTVRSPRTKAEVLDRMLSYNFTGDLRQLSPDPNHARMQRIAPNKLTLHFDDTDTDFEIVVRRPRGENHGSHVAGTQSGKEKSSAPGRKSQPAKKPGKQPGKRRPDAPEPAE